MSEQSVRCAKCDFENPSNITFCGSCSFNLKKGESSSSLLEGFIKGIISINCLVTPIGWIWMYIYRNDKEFSAQTTAFTFITPIVLLIMTPLFKAPNDDLWNDTPLILASVLLIITSIYTYSLNKKRIS